MEKLHVRCPSCDRKLQFEEKHRGRRIKCPKCSGTVLLEPTVTPAKSNPVVDDPFAEMADSSSRPNRPVRRRTTPTTTESAGSVHLRPDTAPKKKRPLPEAKVPKAPDVGTGDSNPGLNPADLEDFSSAEDPAVDEGYIDELGLGELTELQSDSEPVSATLPPVKKQFIKKTAKRTLPEELEKENAPKSRKSRRVRNPDSPVTPSTGRWLVYALFFMTLIPLCANVLMSDERDIQERVEESLQQAEESGEWQEAEIVEGEPVQLDELIRAMPGDRVVGALLARDTWMHWVFAAISGIGFLLLFVALFRRFQEALGGAVTGAIFTATAGIVLLLGLQWAAMYSQGVWVRGRGIIVLLFYVVKFIGFSYQCALNEGNSFMTSFMGFTLGVGICEELCKILPVLVYLGTAKKSTWQGTCLVGLASGVGFGVSEGIMYSSSYYNGISGGEIYLVRFVSCVALHAVWTGAGSVLLYFNQDAVIGGAELSDVLFTLAWTLGISIILHGLYDTLLKQELEIQALWIGAISVAWLIGVVEKQSQFDAASAHQLTD